MEFFLVTESDTETVTVPPFINFKKIWRSSNWSRL